MKAAISYLSSRGITKEDILKYRLGYCNSGDYRYRIIIPSFDSNGSLNFFVGRKFYENIGVPYKHGIFDKDIIFNDYMIDWASDITLVEGPFDMMKAGMNSIPLQGSELSKESKLFHKIVESNVTVYIALDKDARKKQIKNIKKLLGFGVNVFDIKVEVGDVGDMTKDGFNKVKGLSKQISTEIDLIRMRIST